MSHVNASIGSLPYAVTLSTGVHRLTADEPVAMGGSEQGPTPHQLLLSSLAACTSITLKMYAIHQHWPLDGLDVTVAFARDEDDENIVVIDRTIALHGDLNDAQTAELLDLAERTPVTRTIKPGMPVRTELHRDAELAEV